MVEEYMPLDYPSNWIYGPEYWYVRNQDIFMSAWNMLVYGLTGKFPPYDFHVIKWCGNCQSQIAYKGKRPSNCETCHKKIKWE
jgi:hypothetical protein